jgi:hypothetical protein
MPFILLYPTFFRVCSALKHRIHLPVLSPIGFFQLRTVLSASYFLISPLLFYITPPFLTSVGMLSILEAELFSGDYIILILFLIIFYISILRSYYTFDGLFILSFFRVFALFIFLTISTPRSVPGRGRKARREI